MSIQKQKNGFSNSRKKKIKRNESIDQLIFKDVEMILSHSECHYPNKHQNPKIENQNYFTWKRVYTIQKLAKKKGDISHNKSANLQNKCSFNQF